MGTDVTLGLQGTAAGPLVPERARRNLLCAHVALGDLPRLHFVFEPVTVALVNAHRFRFGALSLQRRTDAADAGAGAEIGGVGAGVFACMLAAAEVVSTRLVQSMEVPLWTPAIAERAALQHTEGVRTVFDPCNCQRKGRINRR